MARLANVTLRQLQWWDEESVVSVAKENPRLRVYDLDDAIRVLFTATMRRKGVSLQRIRKILPIIIPSLNPSLIHGQLFAVIQHKVSPVAGQVAMYSNAASANNAAISAQWPVHVVDVAALYRKAVNRA